MPVIGLELGTSRSAGEHLNHYTTEYTRKSRLKNTMHKCRFMDFNEFLNLEWKLRSFDENEMWNDVLCLHYSDNISCNNSSTSQHWVLLICSQPIKTRVTTPSYNNCSYCYCYYLRYISKGTMFQTLINVGLSGNIILMNLDCKYEIKPYFLNSYLSPIIRT